MTQGVQESLKEETAFKPKVTRKTAEMPVMRGNRGRGRRGGIPQKGKGHTTANYPPGELGLDVRGRKRGWRCWVS